MKKNKFNIQLKIRILIFFIFLIYCSFFIKIRFSLILMLIGGLFNLLCVISNNGKMPSFYGKNDSIHKRYINRKEIKLWFLSDFILFLVPLSKKRWIQYSLSIGDILIIIGLLCFLI